jgi:hypothetical protein
MATAVEEDRRYLEMQAPGLGRGSRGRAPVTRSAIWRRLCWRTVRCKPRLRFWCTAPKVGGWFVGAEVQQNPFYPVISESYQELGYHLDAYE